MLRPAKITHTSDHSVAYVYCILQHKLQSEPHQLRFGECTSSGSLKGSIYLRYSFSPYGPVLPQGLLYSHRPSRLVHLIDKYG
jgi:hypothetical protein